MVPRETGFCRLDQNQPTLIIELGFLRTNGLKIDFELQNQMTLTGELEFHRETGFCRLHQNQPTLTIELRFLKTNGLMIDFELQNQMTLTSELRIASTIELKFLETIQFCNIRILFISSSVLPQ